MARLIIEEVNRLGHVTGRHSFEQFPVTVGRGYQNNLIIDDPYISADHIHIDETETGWQIEDQQSENGVKYRLHSNQSQPGNLNSGDEIIIGRTRLRLLSPAHPVAKTHLLPTRASVSKLLANPAAVITTIGITILLLLIDYQLSIPVKTGTEKLIASMFPTFLFALTWAGIWAFVGRVIIHRATFLPHFVAALVVFIISMITATISEYLVFNLSDKTVATIFEFIIIGFTIAGLFYVNLTNSTNLNKKSNLITSHCVAWSMLLMGLFMQYVNKPEFSHAPDYASQLKPPFAKVATTKSLEDFIKDSEKVFKDHSKE